MAFNEQNSIGADGLTDRQRTNRKIPSELLRWLQKQHDLSYGEAQWVLEHAQSLLTCVIGKELGRLPMASGIDEMYFDLILPQTTTERLIAEARLSPVPG